MDMVRQGVLNLRHYNFTEKANVIAKVQVYLVYHGPGCSVVEASQQCVINCINPSNERKTAKNFTHGGTLLPLFGPITGELL